MTAAVEPSKTIEIQERDIDLLRGLFVSRIMTLDHIAAIHFNGKREMAKKRVQKLKSAGYIGERSRHASAPSVLYLSNPAFKLLQERGELSGFPRLTGPALLKRAQVSELTLQHELDVMSVKASIVSAIRMLNHLNVAEFSTWPLLNQFTIRRSEIDPVQSGDQIVKPDGFVRVHESETDGGVSEHTFFLELDRSTETQDKLAHKARCYLQYYRSGGFAKKQGRSVSEREQFPFLVLFVCKSAARRDNGIERLLQNDPPTLTQAWLTTFQEVTTDPLGAIWIRPRDFRDARRNHADDAVRRHSLFDV